MCVGGEGGGSGEGCRRGGYHAEPLVVLIFGRKFGVSVKCERGNAVESLPSAVFIVVVKQSGKEVERLFNFY